jgi:drug/metabolite transporter (DMT)-like permease
MAQQGTRLAAPLAVLFSAVLWGTLWIPVRRMGEAGSGGPWATTLGFFLPLVILLPVALGRGRRTLEGLRALGPASLWLALGIALYAEGVVRGQIARVILLFYLTPVWSTLLARIVLGAPITGRRLATMALGLAGMLVIFGAGAGIPGPRGAGDWMGLSAGFAWAVAIVHVNREPGPRLFDRVFVPFVFLGPVFFLVTLIPGDGGSDIALRLVAGSLPWLLALGLLWMLPAVWLTVFGATHVEPGRFAILLMLEIVVGLTTAWLLTDEPHGTRELLGAALVLGAIGAEVRPSRAGR